MEAVKEPGHRKEMGEGIEQEDFGVFTAQRVYKTRGVGEGSQLSGRARKIWKAWR